MYSKSAKTFTPCTYCIPFKKLIQCGTICQRNYAISIGNAYVARFNVFLQKMYMCNILCTCERDSMEIGPSKVSRIRARIFLLELSFQNSGKIK